MRLARFNVITNPLHPSRERRNRPATLSACPVLAAALTVAALVLTLLKLSDSDRSLNRFALGLPLSSCFLVAILMMSTVRYPSGKKVDMQTQTRLEDLRGSSWSCSWAWSIMYKEVSLLCICLAYVFYGLIRHWRRPRPGAASARQDVKNPARGVPVTFRLKNKCPVAGIHAACSSHPLRTPFLP